MTPMAKNDVPQMTLRFSPIAWAVAIVFTVLGLLAVGWWGEQGLGGELVGDGRRVRLELLLMLLVVVGPGFLIMVQQRIDLYANRLESRLLLSCKTLDRATLRVVRETTNGYLVADASGQKI